MLNPFHDTPSGFIFVTTYDVDVTKGQQSFQAFMSCPIDLKDPMPQPLPELPKFSSERLHANDGYNGLPDEIAMEIWNRHNPGISAY